MASKTVFVPADEYPFVNQTDSPHSKLKVLEISTRSKDPFGKSLSPLPIRAVKSLRTARSLSICIMVRQGMRLSISELRASVQSHSGSVEMSIQ